MPTTGCGLWPGGSAAATWAVAPNQEISAATSNFTVLVSRLGCNSGVTGEAQQPEVQLDDGEVIITFTVRPDEPSSATCPSNDQVPYDVELGEPLGDRALVDGQCLSGAEAVGTADCPTDGVRYSS
jgi:hypothetical protein